MSFTTFCENLMTEGVNVGETMEGIFAIAVGAYIAHGKLDYDIINKIRSSTNLTGGKGKVIIDSNIVDNANLAGIRADPNDKISVSVEMNLRSGNVTDMFGDEIAAAPNLDPLINMVIQKVPNLSAIKKVHEFIVSVLTNNRIDDIEFVVVANGVSGSTTHGDIKGDVILKIHARTKTEIPKYLKEPISFSLKTGERNRQVSNLGIFGGLLKLGQVYDLNFVDGMQDVKAFPEKYAAMQDLIFAHPDKWNDPDHFISYLRKYLQISDSFLSKKDTDFEGGGKERKMQQSTAELEQLRNLLLRFMKAFTEEVKGKDSDVFSTDPHDRLFASKTFEFFKKEIFGSDASSNIHITDSDIREIKKADFEEMKYNYVIKVESSPKLNGIMNFIGIDMEGNRKTLFRIIPRLEYNIKTSKKTQILNIEIGDLS